MFKPILQLDDSTPDAFYLAWKMLGFKNAVLICTRRKNGDWSESVYNDEPDDNKLQSIKELVTNRIFKYALAMKESRHANN